ncbi:MAG: hypothetical protein ACFB6S_18120 [Geminicoccaceae bacterium]
MTATFLAYERTEKSPFEIFVGPHPVEGWNDLPIDREKLDTPIPFEPHVRPFMAYNENAKPIVGLLQYRVNRILQQPTGILPISSCLSTPKGQAKKNILSDPIGDLHYGILTAGATKAINVLLFSPSKTNQVCGSRSPRGMIAFQTSRLGQ